MQIIILGMHRSGTSMVTRLVNLLGAYIGPEHSLLEQRSKQLSHSNAKGHWERWDVMDINQAILAQHSASWTHPVPAMPHSGPISWESLSEAQRQAISLCVYGLDAHRPWVLKDPRLCLTFPAWRPALEVPLAVIVSRSPHEIAQSLHARNGMPHAQAMALWEYYMSQALNHTLTIPRFFISYEEILQRPVVMLEALYHWLVNQGVRRLSMPSTTELHAFVDSSLRRNVAASGHGFTNQQQQVLWQIFSGETPQLGYVECSPASLQHLKKA